MQSKGSAGLTAGASRCSLSASVVRLNSSRSELRRPALPELPDVLVVLRSKHIYIRRNFLRRRSEIS
jgi:hypothetical protein